MAGGELYDCTIVGAGPGGLQAAIYLGRYNRKVLLIDRGGGRTWHARHIENFLTQPVITGAEIISRGLEQARNFNVEVRKGTVTSITKKGHFEVSTAEAVFRSQYVVVSSGVYDNFPEIENFRKVLGTSFFTCVDCDGYRTTGRKLLLVGNSVYTVRLAFAMKEMYTSDIALLLIIFDPPEDYREALADEGIPLIKGRPLRIIGEDRIEGLELKDGRVIPCEMIMSNFGFKLNNAFLAGLDLKRDAKGFKYVTNHHYESSLSGLYIVGPLNTGHDQVVIAAGEGAVAAIDINHRLLDL